jgi:hypothetical protein
MRRSQSLPALASCLLVVAACSAASTTPTATVAPAASTPAVTLAPTANPTANPTAGPSPSPSPSAPVEATGVPTAIDPCQLVTAKEAATLTGVPFGPGDESTSGITRLCSYGQEGNVFEVLVDQAPDAATAKAAEKAAEAEFAKSVPVGIKVTRLSGLEPGVDAAMADFKASAGGSTIAGIGIYLLKGAVFVAISDVAVGGTTPSASAMQDQAKVALGRVP